MVDGTLVFGTPLISLLAQSQLVEGKQLGMALSTAALGVYYALLATWVWRSGPETLRRIGEAFVALAVAFATIAIPLAIDDALTTTLVWALEGAGLYWIGARQQRWLARASGAVLQLFAAFAFVWATDLGGYAIRSASFLRIANTRFLSGIAIAGAGAFIAREAYALRSRLPGLEWQLAQGLAGWGLLWWAGAWGAEIDQFVASEYEVTAAIAAIGISAFALERASSALLWLPGRLLSLAVIPAAWLAWIGALDTQPHLLAAGGAIAWPLLLALIYALLRRLESTGVAWVRWSHAPTFWLVALVIATALAGLADVPLALPGDWAFAAFAIGPVAALLGAHRLLDAGVGPFARFPAEHLAASAAPVVGFAALYFVMLNGVAHGEAAPLPYLPLLSPTDAALALLAVAMLDWWLRVVHTEPAVLPGAWRAAVVPAFATLAFVWLTGLVARSVVQWAGVPFRAGALWDATPFQSALSISWTLVALAGMVWSTRRSRRAPWLAAATLLGVTVVKLFLVDLSKLSTGTKIATFLVVGALLLVVGYLSPVPPARAETASGGDAT